MSAETMGRPVGVDTDIDIGFGVLVSARVARHLAQRRRLDVLGRVDRLADRGRAIVARASAAQTASKRFDSLGLARSVAVRHGIDETLLHRIGSGTRLVPGCREDLPDQSGALRPDAASKVFFDVIHKLPVSPDPVAVDDGGTLVDESVDVIQAGLLVALERKTKDRRDELDVQERPIDSGPRSHLVGVQIVISSHERETV